MMMIRRMLIIFGLWIGTGLACYVPIGITEPLTKYANEFTRVDSVRINPQESGGGTFIAVVDYYARAPAGKKPPRIECTLYSPAGHQSIGEIYPPGGDDYLVQSDTISFVANDPGLYEVECVGLGNQGGSGTGKFKILKPTSTPTLTQTATKTATVTKTMTSTPVVTTTPTNTDTQAILPVKGKILFDKNGIQSSRAVGGKLDDVTKWCVPEVTIAADRTISGLCEYKGQTFVEKAYVTATVTGMVDPSGNVSFSYDVSEIGDPNGAWRVSFEGKGTFTPNNKQATGTAVFTYACNSGAENLLWCFGYTSESADGTIPWRFEAFQ
jgi:hypothetical protein